MRILYVSNKVILLGIAYFCALSFAPIVLLKYGDLSKSMNMIVILIWLLAVVPHCYLMLFDKKVYFNNEGVGFQSLFKKKFIKWDEVKEVGVVIYAPFAGHGTATFLCISTQQAVTGRSIVVFEDHSIYMKYRKSLIPILRKYWKGEIIG
ncbi:hypothetical protein [Paenibacillus camerounensis]|uniref:hypothetical protein n=1 Tax=Paenibacillus camerounensis TaxID=1243663 RepID=UPI0005A8D9D4|nr:hypothetical protein [Paenibacillus camerounensis]